MAHKHSVYDTDLHFSIDPLTRGITNLSKDKIVIVQHDHNSERFTFEVPRYVEGHDMSRCNVVQVHYLNIEAAKKDNKNAGIYEVNDLQVSPDDDDVIILSWLISGNATKFVGSLNFVVRFCCVDEDGTVEYAWNTAVFSNVFVSTGIFNSELIEEQYEDFLTKWLDKVEDLAVDAAVSELADELAVLKQLPPPEFANSIEELEENGDTRKLYVLPDGYIYAYTAKRGALFTDQIRNAIDTDGTPYNGGLGFIRDWKLNAGGDLHQNDVSTGYLTTGFIPYNPATTKVVRFCGWPSKLTLGLDHVHFYDASFNHVPVPSIASWVESYDQTFEKETAFTEDVYTSTFDLDTFTLKSPHYGDAINNKAKYIRMSIQYPVVSCAVVTFDEEIAFGTDYRWQNTGHQFVPADYEDRIIPLEKSAANHDERIRTLEMYGANSTNAEDVPAYIKAEADGVMARLLEKQGNRCFTMVGISDFHYGGMGDNKDNLIRACKAISYMQGRIHFDAVATLGDNIPHGESTEDTLKSGNRWLKEINEILKMTESEGVAMFRTPGNHDRMGGNDASGNPTEPISDDDMYRYIGGYNRGCVMDVPGGWGYRDFETYKLRVIVLNTSETEGKGRFSEFSGYHMSGKQYRWLIDTLDMSSKADATDWQILLLSHHRPDDYQVGVVGNEWGADRFVLPNILHAYRTGGSYSATLMEDNTVVSCDFVGKNQAALIGSIHGHHHAYIYGNLRLGNFDTDTETDVLAISTPTSSFGSGEGHNDDNEGNWYDSVKDTAEETAFCVYSIDLDNHVIHAIHYGSGIDREISYTIPNDRAENITKYSVDSVNGKTGSVVLTADDVGALAKDGKAVINAGDDGLTLNAPTKNAYVLFNTTGNDASMGIYSDLAYICNEGATGARMGIYGNGEPQYWSGRTKDTAKTLLHTGNAEEKLGLTYTDSPLPFADIKCGNAVDSSMWLCDHVYQKGYVKHIKTRLMSGSGVKVNAGIVKASDLTLLRKYSVTANVGEVIIPVDEYIDCDFYVALAGAGLDFVGGKYSVYPFKYITGAATTYLTSLNEGDVIGRTFSEFTADKTTYVLAQEVEYNGRYNTSAPYTYTRNKMFAAGDSITAGYYSKDGQGYSVNAGSKWWSIVGRTIGYKTEKVASTGSGFAFLKNETNACTLIEDVNFKSYDVAVFAFGTNDYGQNTPIGAIDDAYTSATDTSLTFYAAVKHVVEKVLTSNPTCALIFALPINRCDKGTIASNWAFGTANAAGHTLSDYCDAIIAVCNKYGIPYIDRRNSIFNAYTLQTLLIDKVHPSEEGYKLLGMELSARIGALIRPYAEHSGE